MINDLKLLKRQHL